MHISPHPAIPIGPTYGVCALFIGCGHFLFVLMLALVQIRLYFSYMPSLDTLTKPEPRSGELSTLQLRDVMQVWCAEYWLSDISIGKNYFREGMGGKLKLAEALATVQVISDEFVQPYYETYLTKLQLECEAEELPIPDYLMSSDGRFFTFFLNDIFSEDALLTIDDMDAYDIFRIFEECVIEAEDSDDEYTGESVLLTGLFNEWLRKLLVEGGATEFEVGWVMGVVLPRHELRQDLNGKLEQVEYDKFAKAGGKIGDYLKHNLPRNIMDDSGFLRTITDELGEDSESVPGLSEQARFALAKRWVEAEADYYSLLEDNYLWHHKGVIPDDVRQVLEWLNMPTTPLPVNNY